MTEAASSSNVSQSHCDLSVIVPLLNEEGNVGPLYTELREVLQATDFDYEIIFIDDGSEDRALDCLRAATASDGRTTTIVLRRNFGQTAALAAGIGQSRG